VCVWMSVVKLFSNRYVYSFRPFLAKLGAHNLCANNENHGTYFRNFDFKIFGDFFLIFQFGLRYSSGLSA